MEIKYKKIGDLTPYTNNARTHSDEQVDQIVASIKEFGFTNRKGRDNSRTRTASGS